MKGKIHKKCKNSTFKHISLKQLVVKIQQLRLPGGQSALMIRRAQQHTYITPSWTHTFFYLHWKSRLGSSCACGRINAFPCG